MNQFVITMGVNIGDKRLVITTERKTIHFHLPKYVEHKLNRFHHGTQCLFSWAYNKNQDQLIIVQI